MPRDISSATETAATAEVIRPVNLVALDMAVGWTRITDLPYSIDLDADGDGVAETFIGVGRLGAISPVEETTETKAKRVELILSGVKAAQISDALAAGYRLRPGYIYRAYRDANGQITGGPVLRFRGLMETMRPRLGDIGEGSRAQIVLTLVNRMARWERPMDTPRWDDADHQARRPGDTFFSRMPEIAAGKETVWGKG